MPLRLASPAPAVVDADVADRYHAAVLTHADDRVVASIGNVEVRALIEGCVARPIDVVRVSLNGRKIDGQIQRRRADATDRTQTKDLVGGGSEGDEVDDRDRVVEWLTDKQLPYAPVPACTGS